MVEKTHDYEAHIVWTGNSGDGTRSYKSYARTWELASPGKSAVMCSNDPLLGGDPTKYNPEDLLICAIASCHMLWYLHLCSQAGIVVQSYADTPLAVGVMEPSGAGQFQLITLRPKILIDVQSDAQKAHALHHDVHQYCFIARSINFPVEYAPEITKA